MDPLATLRQANRLIGFSSVRYAIHAIGSILAVKNGVPPYRSVGPLHTVSQASAHIFVCIITIPMCDLFCCRLLTMRLIPIRLYWIWIVICQICPCLAVGFGSSPEAVVVDLDCDVSDLSIFGV